MVKILRKSKENHEAPFRKFSVFIGHKSIFRLIAFKILKMEFKVKYKILITKV